MMAEKADSVQFAPFSSALDPNFWHSLSKMKLNVYGLDDKERKIHGVYSNGYAQGIPFRLNLDYTAFDEKPVIPATHYPANGTLKNFNTIDEFKVSNKLHLLEEQGLMLWKDIKGGEAIANPDLLARFYLLTFSDLKKYHYYYWFAFPALNVAENVSLIKPVQTISERLTDTQLSSLMSSFDDFSKESSTHGFFIIKETSDSLVVSALSSFDTVIKEAGKVMFGFCDPCTLEKYPGWPLRNLLTLIAVHWAAALNSEVEVLCLRDRYKDGKRSILHSIVLNLHVKPITNLQECPKCVGWEKNEKQKMGPRMVNLSATMDPSRLAEAAVDLNLKLMRWRLLPELDLETISATKCLLLGAGTLGCNVARNLLGWGVRTITLVDNGKVSYSNPVRQSLFCFEDSINGGSGKAETAATALQKIFPGVNSRGITLSIPMPGHTISESVAEQTKKDVETLEELIDQHDVVFLLMDTRESRWLPTLIGFAKGKIVMNAALGFDTYLVLRHGVRIQESQCMDTSDNRNQTEGAACASGNQAEGAACHSGNQTGAHHSMLNPVYGQELGCYFCNDVVAPGDSTRDRTLDQQCTVSRPGMSFIVSALVVELLVSTLTHPQRGNAPADTSSKEDHLTQDIVSPLGLVPHQIRGFLSRFHTVMPASRRFDKCTACSQTVIEHYERNGFSFLLNAFNMPSFLEDLTGLTKLHAETQLSEVWEMSDDEDF